MGITGYSGKMRAQLKDYVLCIVADKEQGRDKLTDSEQIKLTAELYADAGLHEIITTNSGSWSDVSQQWNAGRGRGPASSKIYGAITLSMLTRKPRMLYPVRKHPRSAHWR